MAQRDRSQGFAFVYVDIAKILSERDQLKDPSMPVENPTAKTINFNKDPLPKPATVLTDEISQDARGRRDAIAQVRANLDRLQALHHKLHAMLAELNQVTDDKKKRN